MKKESLQKLINLATYLDGRGATEEAAQIDRLLISLAVLPEQLNMESRTQMGQVEDGSAPAPKGPRSVLKISLPNGKFCYPMTVNDLMAYVRVYELPQDQVAKEILTNLDPNSTRVVALPEAIKAAIKAGLLAAR